MIMHATTCLSDCLCAHEYLCGCVYVCVLLLCSNKVKVWRECSCWGLLLLCAYGSCLLSDEAHLQELYQEDVGEVENFFCRYTDVSGSTRSFYYAEC